MLRSSVLLTSCVILGACATIKINHGDTSTLKFRGDAAVAKNLATRACRQGGQHAAEILSIINEDASRPDGEGRQVATFRCLAAERPPQVP
jgi:hypothetical protein